MKMKKKYAALIAILVFATVTLPMAETQPASSITLRNAMQRQVALGIQTVPKAPRKAGALTSKFLQGTNPFLSQVIDPTKVDFFGWRVAVEAKAHSAQKIRNTLQNNHLTQTLQPLLANELESEALSGLNDTLTTGEPINGFGINANPKAQVLGTLAPPRNVPTNFPTFTEDDGAIPLANQSGVATNFGAMRTSGIIGDGPHGSAASGTGDFDFYSVELSAGQSVIADTDIIGILDSVLVIYNAAGTVVATNDDDGESLASKLTYTPTEAGTFYIMVTGLGTGTSLPEDPLDPASGLGVGSEGEYDLLITTSLPDVDVYALDLRAGDVIGATLNGAGNQLQIFDTSGTEVIGSSQDLSSLYPDSSPLPGGGNAVLAYTVSVDGRYFIAINGNQGTYNATLEVYRAGLENKPRRSVQTILLDFDGARVQTSKFDSGSGVRDLTGLTSFLDSWGLEPKDENALIDAIVQVVNENLRQDLIERGLNQYFNVEIVDNRHAGIEFGEDYVSRVIIGGTIEETGIATIGVASSIDPGNFGYEDDAIVLLDLLSAPPPEANSLNTYLAASVEGRIKLIAIGIGNIVSHEAGHFLGNYHTDQFNQTPNIMDQGGNLPNKIGAGADQLLGTIDDVDVDFGLDKFVLNEGSTGIHDTLNNSAFGLTGSKSGILLD